MTPDERKYNAYMEESATFMQHAWGTKGELANLIEIDGELFTPTPLNSWVCTATEREALEEWARDYIEHCVHWARRFNQAAIRVRREIEPAVIQATLF